MFAAPVRSEIGTYQGPTYQVRTGAESENASALGSSALQSAQRNHDLTDPRILLHVAVCRGVFIQSDKDPIDLRRKAARRQTIRGCSEDDAPQVLLLSPATEHPPSQSLKRLEHEYSLREVLRSLKKPF
jgi:hypothetical protein